MGSPLRGVSAVRWRELRDARGAPADGIPPLLSRVAYGGEDTARQAIDELGDMVCALGFVVGEATAEAVPFLVELAGAPHVPCTAELLHLLESVCRADAWHASAAAAGGRQGTASGERPGWEAASLAAVRAGRPVVEALAGSVRPEESGAARALLAAMDGARPFPAAGR